MERFVYIKTGEEKKKKKKTREIRQGSIIFQKSIPMAPAASNLAEGFGLSALLYPIAQASRRIRGGFAINSRQVTQHSTQKHCTSTSAGHGQSALSACSGFRTEALLRGVHASGAEARKVWGWSLAPWSREMGRCGDAKANVKFRFRAYEACSTLLSSSLALLQETFAIELAVLEALSSSWLFGASRYSVHLVLWLSICA